MDDFVGSEQQTQIAMGYGTSASAIPGGESSYNVTLANAGLLYKINEQHQVWEHSLRAQVWQTRLNSTE